MTITRLHPDGSDERELRYRLGVEKNRQSGLGAPTPEKPITTPTAIIKKTIEEARNYPALVVAELIVKRLATAGYL